jgi:hypothetical protein
LAPLSEVLATSDLTKGAVNLLTGSVEEIGSQFGSHMEIHSVSCQLRDEKVLAALKESGAENMKRIVDPMTSNLALENLLSFVEYKTVWHPIGH